MVVDLVMLQRDPRARAAYSFLALGWSVNPRAVVDGFRLCGYRDDRIPAAVADLLGVDPDEVRAVVEHR
jgi:hypothetical protein